jgi:Putative prokaryotic signal transducing protein
MRLRLRRSRRDDPVGDPVKVANARNQAEAEFIQALLREEGIPSMLRRSAGFDVPDFLAAGPRDVLVPAAAADLARQILTEGRPRG